MWSCSLGKGCSKGIKDWVSADYVSAFFFHLTYKYVSLTYALEWYCYHFRDLEMRETALSVLFALAHGVLCFPKYALLIECYTGKPHRLKYFRIGLSCIKIKLLYCFVTIVTIDLSYKSHNALDKCHKVHHFVTGMYTYVHISVWCTVGYRAGALWILCNRSFVIILKLESTVFRRGETLDNELSSVWLYRLQICMKLNKWMIETLKALSQYRSLGRNTLGKFVQLRRE